MYRWIPVNSEYEIPKHREEVLIIDDDNDYFLCEYDEDEDVFVDYAWHYLFVKEYSDKYPRSSEVQYGTNEEPYHVYKITDWKRLEYPLNRVKYKLLE
jgi:hypothetical protein